MLSIKHRSQDRGQLAQLSFVDATPTKVMTRRQLSVWYTALRAYHTALRAMHHNRFQSI